jgi:hypothetical protein
VFVVVVVVVVVVLNGGQTSRHLGLHLVLRMTCLNHSVIRFVDSPAFEYFLSVNVLIPACCCLVQSLY